MSLTVNICAREPKSFIKYKTTSFTIDTKSVNFPIKIYEKEVTKLSKKQRKEFAIIVKSFIMTTISFLTLSSKSMASELQTTLSQSPVNTVPTEILDPFIHLIYMAIGSSVFLTMLLLISAGILRMLRKKEQSIEWTTDIIKGFIQILITTPLVFLIYYVTVKLLGGFSMFLRPF